MENNTKSKKSNKKGIIIASIIIVVLVVLLVGGYFHHIARPQAVFERNIKKQINQTINYFTPLNEYVTSKGNCKLSYNIKLNEEDKEIQKKLDAINGFTFDTKYQIDFKNKLFDLDVNSKYKEDEAINLKLYAENETQNLFLKGIYDKYITSENYDLADLYHLGNKDIDYEVILDGFKEALLDAIDDIEFKKAKETIKIDGEKVKTTKNYFTLKDDDYIEFYVEIIDNLLDDKEFMKSYEAYEGENAKDALKVLKSEIKDTEYKGNKFSIALYTKGAKKEVVKIVVDKSLYDALTMIELTKLNEDKIQYEYTTNQGVVKGTIKNNIKVDDNKVGGKLELTFDIVDYITGKINIEIDNTFGSKFKKVDVSNNILEDKLSKKDEKKIDKNIAKNKGFAKFKKLMETIEESD